MAILLLITKPDSLSFLSSLQDSDGMPSKLSPAEWARLASSLSSLDEEKPAVLGYLATSWRQLESILQRLRTSPSGPPSKLKIEFFQKTSGVKVISSKRQEQRRRTDSLSSLKRAALEGVRNKHQRKSTKTSSRLSLLQ